MSLLRTLGQKLHWRTNHLRYSGGDKYCPVCKSAVSSFLQIDGEFLRSLQDNRYAHNIFDLETLNLTEYSCPLCNASDRDRMYAVYLGEHLQPDHKVIEFAPSAPLSKFIKSIATNHRTADLFAPADDKVDLMDMPYESGSFDFFVCSHILEHVADDKKAVGELYRILKPGGKGIVMVPIDLSLTETSEFPVETDEERWRHFGQNDHVRLYSKLGFVNLLMDAGFDVEQREMNDARQGIKGVLYVVGK